MLHINHLWMNTFAALLLKSCCFQISPLWCHTGHWSPQVSDHTSMPTVGSALCGHHVFPDVKGRVFGVRLHFLSPGCQIEEVFWKQSRDSHFEQAFVSDLLQFLNTVSTNWLGFLEADVELVSGLPWATQMLGVYRRETITVYCCGYFLGFFPSTALQLITPLNHTPPCVGNASLRLNKLGGVTCTKMPVWLRSHAATVRAGLFNCWPRATLALLVTCFVCMLSVKSNRSVTNHWINWLKLKTCVRACPH